MAMEITLGFVPADLAPTLQRLLEQHRAPQHWRAQVRLARAGPDAHASQRVILTLEASDDDGEIQFFYRSILSRAFAAKAQPSGFLSEPRPALATHRRTVVHREPWSLKPPARH